MCVSSLFGVHTSLLLPVRGISLYIISLTERHKLFDFVFKTDVIKQFLKSGLRFFKASNWISSFSLLKVIKMEKVMAVGFLLIFCVVFLCIEESSGIVNHCPPGRALNSLLPVSAVINLWTWSCFYNIIHALHCFFLLFWNIKGLRRG